MNLPTDKIISCFYESSGDCVKVIDNSGMLLSFNPKGLEIMEIDDPKAVLGKDWLSLWKDDIFIKAQQAFRKALKGEAAYFEGYCPTFKGTPKWWQVNKVPLKNEFDQVQWMLSISRDVTKIFNLQKENRKLKAQLVSMKQIQSAKYLCK